MSSVFTPSNFIDYADPAAEVASPNRNPSTGAGGSATNGTVSMRPKLSRHVSANNSTSGIVSTEPAGVVSLPTGTVSSVLKQAEEKQEGSVTSVRVAEWEGHVTSVGHKSFEARLRGIFGEGVDGQLEDATIPIAEINDFNKSLFAVGAIFRLCVSYDEYQSGQIRRYTDMVFRRLPAYRQKDLDDAMKRARERLSELRLE